MKQFWLIGICAMVCGSVFPQQGTDGAARAETEYRIATLNFIKNRNVGASTKDFENVVELDGTHMNARYRLGMLYYMQGFLGKASEQFDAVVKQNPQLELGIKSRLVLDDIDRLEIQYDTPEKLRHYQYLIRVEDIQSSPGKEDVHQRFSDVLNVYPEYHEAHVVMAKSLLAEGHYGDAALALELAVQKAPDSEQGKLKTLLANLRAEENFKRQERAATELFKQGNYLEAANGFQQAFETNPNEYGVLSLAANCYVQAGDYAQAEKLYGQIQKDGDLKNALYAAKQMYLVKPMAEVEASSQLDIDTLIGGGDYLKAHAAFEKKDENKALRHIEQAIDAITLNPAYSQFYTLRGKVRLKRGDVGAASSDFQEALKINRSDAEARSALCGIYEDEQKFNEALACLRATPSKDHTGYFFLRVGQLEIMVKDYKQADQSLNKALEMAGTAHEKEVAISWLTKLDLEQKQYALAAEKAAGMERTRPSEIKLEVVERKEPPGSPAKPQRGKVKVDFSILD